MQPQISHGVVEVIIFGSRETGVEDKAPGKQQVSSFHEGEVVSCPISPDGAEEMGAIGITDTNDAVLEVPIAKDKNGSPR